MSSSNKPTTLTKEKSITSPTLSPSDTTIKGKRMDKNGLIYITVMGTPEERGYAHGYLLADRIVKMTRTFGFFLWTEYGRDFTFFSQMMQDLFEPIVKEKYNECHVEMTSIAKGVYDKVTSLSTQADKDSYFGKGFVVDDKIVLPDDAFLDYENSPKGDSQKYTNKKIMLNIDFYVIFLLNCVVSVDYVYGKLATILKETSSLSDSKTYAEYYKTDTSAPLPGGSSSDNSPIPLGKIVNFITGKSSESSSSDKCSAFMAVGSNYTSDGKIVCAHITFDNYVMGQFDNIILFLDTSSMSTTDTPSHNILMQTFPGGIFSSTDFFVTSNNFVGIETTIGGFNAFELHAPACVRSRKAMQYSNTLDDYLRYLVENNSGDYANTWYIGHTKSKDSEGKERNEIMRIELGLKYRHVEKKTNGYFIGFNACYDPRIRNLECVNDGYFDVRRHSGARRVTLDLKIKEYTDNGGQGPRRISLTEAEKIMSNHWDVYLEKDNMCSRSICAHYDLDAREFMSQEYRPKPFQPKGAVDAKICSSDLCNNMQFLIRWGAACGRPFLKDDFCNLRPQWDYQRQHLEDRPTKPWVTCSEVNMRNSKSIIENGISVYNFEKSDKHPVTLKPDAVDYNLIKSHKPLVNSKPVETVPQNIADAANAADAADTVAQPTLPVGNINTSKELSSTMGGYNHTNKSNDNLNKHLKDFNKIFKKNNKKSYKIKNTSTRRKKQ